MQAETREIQSDCNVLFLLKEAFDVISLKCTCFLIWTHVIDNHGLFLCTAFLQEPLQSNLMNLAFFPVWQ